MFSHFVPRSFLFFRSIQSFTCLVFVGTVCRHRRFDSFVLDGISLTFDVSLDCSTTFDLSFSFCIFLCHCLPEVPEPDARRRSVLSVSLSLCFHLSIFYIFFLLVLVFNHHLSHFFFFHRYHSPTHSSTFRLLIHLSVPPHLLLLVDSLLLLLMLIFFLYFSNIRYLSIDSLICTLESTLPLSKNLKKENERHRVYPFPQIVSIIFEKESIKLKCEKKNHHKLAHF